MVKQNEIALVAEYERLRYEANQLEKWSEQVDARLVELERILPGDYIFPCDSPDNSRARLPCPLTLPQRIVFLKQVMDDCPRGSVETLSRSRADCNVFRVDGAIRDLSTARNLSRVFESD